MSKEFKQTFCKHYGCREDQFAWQLLRRSLFFSGFVCFLFVRAFTADGFRGERSLVLHVGRAQTVREVKDELDFYHHKHVSPSSLRNALGIRVSGQKLIKMARELGLPGSS